MMFVAQDVLLDVAFGVARPRLVSLASSRAFVDASRAAYQEGLTSLVRAGCPVSSGSAADPVTGITARLARVSFLPPVERADTITVGLRWEASGISAGLFPVLDADITLAAASEQTTTLTLSGVYRPTGEGAGPAGAMAPDHGDSAPPAAQGLMAEVAVRSLLRYAADYLTGPDK
jgi:hypothetical protein